MNAPHTNDRATSFNPNRRFALLTLFATLLITFILILLFRTWDYVFAWLIAINLVAFLVFGYDKAVAPTEATRVPEIVLLVLTALGGSIGAVIARPLFHHKTQKASFRLAFWPCVIISIVLVMIYYTVICPGCR
jgi:uncharacterized membrane protein YsdA (DUF1294 family)